MSPQSHPLGGRQIPPRTGEHLCATLRERLTEWGFDQVSGPAVKLLWRVANGSAVDPDSLEAAQGECECWAPDSEDAPDAEDVVSAVLYAVAAGCELARDVKADSNARALLSDSRMAVKSYASERHLDDPAYPDMESLENAPEVVAELGYQDALIHRLQEAGTATISRADLLGLPLSYAAGQLPLF